MSGFLHYTLTNTHMTPETLQEARRIISQQAGQANLAKHGKEFYKEISRKGVEARKRNKMQTKGTNPQTKT